MLRLKKSVLKQFNDPKTILVVSKYPFGTNAESHHGVATYTEHQLTYLSQATGQKFIVLVQDEYNRPIQLTSNGKLLIVPAFSGSLMMYPQLLRWILLFDKVSLLHIHSEFYTSGNIIQMATAIPFYGLLQLLGKHLIYIAHNVVTNFSFMARHLGKKQTDPVLKWSERLLPYYYKFLSLSVNRLVVLDESVRSKLVKIVSHHKITLSPHWIYPKKTSSSVRTKFRQEMKFSKNDFVLVCFGFMTRYKGVDWLVETVGWLQKNGYNDIKLVLAGGEAPSQKGKKHYQQFYQELKSAVNASKSITLTGFIPEEKLSRYFAIADLVVLPYRGILGASGSWAQAMAHGKPFILSRELSGYLSDETSKKIMNNLQLTEDDLFFRRNKFDFIKLLEKIRAPKKNKKLKQFSQLIAVERSPEKRIAVEYSDLYELPTKSIIEKATFHIMKRVTSIALLLSIASWRLLFSR